LSYSYEEQRERVRRINFILLCALFFFAVYIALTSFVFSMRVMRSESMRPGIHEGDRFIFSSYYLFTPDLGYGNIVLVDMGADDKRNIFSKIFDGFIRFWTFQRFDLSKRDDFFFMKRVVALPGDEVSMTNFVLRVKKKDSPHQVTEFETSQQRRYDVIIPNVPALWDQSLPFSGNMDAITLGDDECFLLSDDRSNTNDSRSWGPVPVKRVIARALFRYWPITRLGSP
jgi:signal peptidase I